MAGCGEQPGGGRRPNMEEEEADMAGCGERPAGDRRPNMDQESDAPTLRMLLMPAAHQEPESSDNSSAEHPQESPEHSPENIEECPKTVFTEAHLNTLEAFYKEKHYPSAKERKQLENQLSAQKRSILNWFRNRRIKMRKKQKFAHQGPESSDDPSAARRREDPDYSPENIQECPRTFFTKAELNTLEAFFKKQQNPIPTEQEKLANQLSVPKHRIKVWFKNRRKKMRTQEKLANQGPESLDDPSAAHPTEDPECLLRNSEMYEKSDFTEEQLNTLEALFTTKRCLTRTELEKLANQLSLPEHRMESWFQNQTKLKHQPVNLHAESNNQPRTESQTPTEDQLDLLHKPNMESTINVARAQNWSNLDNFPPVQHVDSCALPQRLHSSDMVSSQNVGGPPDSCSGTEVSKMLPESGHKPPNDFLLNLSLQNKTIDPKTNICPSGSSVTKNPTSYDGPSTSSAPNTSQMPIALDNFNLPTSIWPHESSITTDLTSYDGPNTSSAPSTSQMPITQDNFNLPETIIWPHESSITTNLTSYDGTSTSSAPNTSQMPIPPGIFNLPRTNIWNPGSSITTNLTSYDGPSTSSEPSTSQMPIAQDNFNMPSINIWPSESFATPDLTSYDGPSTSSAPNAFQMPIAPGIFNLPRTSNWYPGSSITDRTSYDGPSTSSAPSTSQMPIVSHNFNLPTRSIWPSVSPDNFNMPRTNIWPSGSFVAADLTSYDGLSTSSAPSTFQMPIVPHHFHLPTRSIWPSEPSITTDLISYDALSTSSSPSTSQMLNTQDNFHLPTSTWLPVSSVTTELTSYYGLSISSAPITSQMPTTLDNFNLSTTSIWLHESSVTTYLTSYDGPSTSSAPSKSHMPITQDNADDGSSTDTSSINDETTDSD